MRLDYLDANWEEKTGGHVIQAGSGVFAAGHLDAERDETAAGGGVNWHMLEMAQVEKGGGDFHLLAPLKATEKPHMQARARAKPADTDAVAGFDAWAAENPMITLIQLSTPYRIVPRPIPAIPAATLSAGPRLWPP